MGDFRMAESRQFGKPRQDLQIAYVGGWMRSGSTLLAEMIGALPGALSIGEVSGIWRAAERNGPCSCGQPVRSCPVWGAALAVLRQERGVSTDDYAPLAGLAARVLQTRRSWRLASLRNTNPARWPADVLEYATVTEELLQAVAATAGASTLVDSSKLAPGLVLSCLMQHAKTRVTHIVRDPRAVANSERKTRLATDVDWTPPGRSSLKSVAYWSGANLTVRHFGRLADDYLLVSYAALTQRPEGVLACIAAFLDLERDTQAGLLSTGHIAVGNPARFGGSNRGIIADETWRSDMPMLDRALVSALSGPVRALLRPH